MSTVLNSATNGAATSFIQPPVSARLSRKATICKALEPHFPSEIAQIVSEYGANWREMLDILYTIEEAEGIAASTPLEEKVKTIFGNLVKKLRENEFVPIAVKDEINRPHWVEEHCVDIKAYYWLKKTFKGVRQAQQAAERAAYEQSPLGMAMSRMEEMARRYMKEQIYGGCC